MSLDNLRNWQNSASFNLSRVVTGGLLYQTVCLKGKWTNFINFQQLPITTYILFYWICFQEDNDCNSPLVHQDGCMQLYFINNGTLSNFEIDLRFHLYLHEAIVISITSQKIAWLTIQTWICLRDWYSMFREPELERIPGSSDLIRYTWHPRHTTVTNFGLERTKTPHGLKSLYRDSQFNYKRNYISLHTFPILLCIIWGLLSQILHNTETL